MICAKCGAEVADNMKFCGVCGAPVNDKKSSDSEKQNANAKPITVNDVLTDADTASAQSNIAISDVTIEEFIIPEETLSDGMAKIDAKKNSGVAQNRDGTLKQKNKEEKELKKEKSNDVPKRVRRKEDVTSEKEHIAYLQLDKRETIQKNSKPILNNSVYTSGQVGISVKDPYIMVEHTVRNEILASVCMLLMFLFAFVSLFVKSYISTDGSIVKGFTGIEIISGVIIGLLGGSENGSTYFDLFKKEITTNGWVIEGTGLLNQRAVVSISVMIGLIFVLSVAAVDIIRCIMRTVKKRPFNRRFHILSFITLLGVCAMFLLICMHNEFAFDQEGFEAFLRHQATVTVTLNGANRTVEVYSTGIAYILTLFIILTRFILGFFFAKPERMRLSEASEKYPRIYPQKYNEKRTEISHEDYEVIMRNSGAMERPVMPPIQDAVMIRQTKVTEKVSNFDRPVTFEPSPSPSSSPLQTDDKNKTPTTDAVSDKVTVIDYTVTENSFPDCNTEANQTMTTQNLDDNSQVKIKKGR